MFDTIVAVSLPQPHLGDALSAIWSAACEDARIDVCSLLLFPRAGKVSHDQLTAKTWPKDRLADTGDLSETWVRPYDRVEIWTTRSEQGLAGLLRHELEHVRQLRYYRKRGGKDSELWELYHDAFELVSDGTEYQRIPMEADANAAASRFVRRLYGDESIDKLLKENDDDRAVFGPTRRPKPRRTLLKRMQGVVVNGVIPAAA